MKFLGYTILALLFFGLAFANGMLFLGSVPQALLYVGVMTVAFTALLGIIWLAVWLIHGGKR